MIEILAYLFRTKRKYFVLSRSNILAVYLWLVFKKISYVSLNEFRIRIGAFDLVACDIDQFTKIFVDIFVKSQYYSDINDRYKKSMRVVDVGSHIGLSVIYFRLLFPKSKILGVEASPMSYALLKQNIQRNKMKKVRVLKGMVSNHKGIGVFYIDEKNPTSWANSAINSGTHFTKVKIPSIRLSEYIVNKVDLLKIDAEGSELEILTDLDKAKRFGEIDRIIIEYHHNGLNRRNAIDLVLEVLRRNGYTFMFDYSLRKRWALLPASTLVTAFGKEYNMLIYATKIFPESGVSVEQTH